MDDKLITDLLLLNVKMVKRIEEMEKVIIDLHGSVSLHSIILKSIVEARINELTKFAEKMESEDEGVH